MRARLTTGLNGHPAVGHLRLDGLVQGSDIVLQGVEPVEAALLGPVLRQAIAAANDVCARAADDLMPRNMDPAQAQQVASVVSAGALG
jgi:hypothetical protein